MVEKANKVKKDLDTLKSNLNNERSQLILRPPFADHRFKEITPWIQEKKGINHLVSFMYTYRDVVIGVIERNKSFYQVPQVTQGFRIDPGSSKNINLTLPKKFEKSGDGKISCKITLTKEITLIKKGYDNEKRVQKRFFRSH